MFVNLDADLDEKDRTQMIYRDFLPSSSSRKPASWKRHETLLPVNVSKPYAIVLEASAGIRRGRSLIAVDNITLSKECFGIGKFDEISFFSVHKRKAAS